MVVNHHITGTVTSPSANISGTITISSSVGTLKDSTGAVVWTGTASFPVTNGVVDVTLPATDDAGISPKPFLWKGAFKSADGKVTIPLRFDLTADRTFGSLLELTAEPITLTLLQQIEQLTTQANGYATAAAGSASAATASATAAQVSAGAAADSATDADLSSDTAVNAANDAKGYRDQAVTSATSAGTSAANAGTSATNAANSANSAATSAATATARKNDADTAATNATTAATTAAGSATQAGNSATASQTSRLASDASATNAANSATAAAGSATGAAGSATAAAGSATTASAGATTVTNALVNVPNGFDIQAKNWVISPTPPASGTGFWTGANGWTATRDGSKTKVGTGSFLLTNGASGGNAGVSINGAGLTGLTPGLTYYFTAWTWVPTAATGSANVAIRAGSTGAQVVGGSVIRSSSAQITAKDQWIPLSISFIPTGTAVSFYFYGANGVNDQTWFDGLMITESPNVGYFDGSMPNARWTGTAYNSISELRATRYSDIDAKDVATTAAHVAAIDPHPQYRTEASLTTGITDTYYDTWLFASATAGGSTTTGAVLVTVPISSAASTMIELEVELWTYDTDSINKTTLYATCYSQSNGNLTRANVRLRSDGYLRNQANPIHNPTVSWTRATGGTALYLMIGGTTDVNQYLQAKVVRMSTNYLSGGALGAPVVGMTTSAPTGIALAVRPTDTPAFYRGTGSPEAVVAAPIGAEYVDTAATTGAIKWVKTTSVAFSTGWRVTSGDTGWRTLASWNSAGVVSIGSLPSDWAPFTGQSGYLQVRRVNERVTIRVRFISPTVNNTVQSMWNGGIPSGWRNAEASVTYIIPWFSSGAVFKNFGLTAGLTRGSNFSMAAGDYVTYHEFSWITEDPWPTTLP